MGKRKRSSSPLVGLEAVISSGVQDRFSLITNRLAKVMGISIAFRVPEVDPHQQFDTAFVSKSGLISSKTSNTGLAAGYIPTDPRLGKLDSKRRPRALAPFDAARLQTAQNLKAGKQPITDEGSPFGIESTQVAVTLERLYKSIGPDNDYKIVGFEEGKLVLAYNENKGPSGFTDQIVVSLTDRVAGMKLHDRKWAAVTKPPMRHGESRQERATAKRSWAAFTAYCGKNSIKHDRPNLDEFAFSVYTRSKSDPKKLNPMMVLAERADNGALLPITGDIDVLYIAPPSVNHFYPDVKVDTFSALDQAGETNTHIDPQTEKLYSSATELYYSLYDQLEEAFPFNEDAASSVSLPTITLEDIHGKEYNGHEESSSDPIQTPKATDTDDEDDLRQSSPGDPSYTLDTTTLGGRRDGAQSTEPATRFPSFDDLVGGDISTIRLSGQTSAFDFVMAQVLNWIYTKHPDFKNKAGAGLDQVMSSVKQIRHGAENKFLESVAPDESILHYFSGKTRKTNSAEELVSLILEPGYLERFNPEINPNWVKEEPELWGPVLARKQAIELTFTIGEQNALDGYISTLPTERRGVHERECAEDGLETRIGQERRPGLTFAYNNQRRSISSPEWGPNSIRRSSSAASLNDNDALRELTKQAKSTRKK